MPCEGGVKHRGQGSGRRGRKRGAAKQGDVAKHAGDLRGWGAERTRGAGATPQSAASLGRALCGGRGSQTPPQGARPSTLEAAVLRHMRSISALCPLRIRSVSAPHPLCIRSVSAPYPLRICSAPYPICVPSCILSVSAMLPCNAGVQSAVAMGIAQARARARV